MSAARRSKRQGEKFYAAKAAAFIAEERRRKRLTQQELADRMGRPQSFVSKCEAMERRLDLDDLSEYARALETEFPRFVKSLLA